MATLDTETLVRVKCYCGCVHAVPESLRKEQMRQFNDGHSRVMSLHCPLGHTYRPVGEPQCEKLKRRIQQERAEADRQRMQVLRERERTALAERRRAAQKGVTTKIKKRVAAGVCPCCNRTFQDLARHMAGQHPEFTKDEKED